MTRETVELDRQSFMELVGSRCVGYRRVLFPVCDHKVKPTLFLSQAYYEQIGAGLGNWWFATREYFYERTGLSRWDQERSRKLLREKGLLEERVVQNARGQPQLAFRLDDQALADALSAQAAAETVNGSARWSVVSPSLPSVGQSLATGEGSPMERNPKCDGQNGAIRPIGGLETDQQGGESLANRVVSLQPTGRSLSDQQGGQSPAIPPTTRVKTREKKESSSKRELAAASFHSLFREATPEDRERFVAMRLADKEAKGEEVLDPGAYAGTLRSLPSDEVMMALVVHDQRLARREAAGQAAAESKLRSARANLARRNESANAAADRAIERVLFQWFEGLAEDRRGEILEARRAKTIERLAGAELAAELDGSSPVAAAAAVELERDDLLDVLKGQADVPGFGT